MTATAPLPAEPQAPGGRESLYVHVRLQRAERALREADVGLVLGAVGQGQQPRAITWLPADRAPS